MVDFAEAINKLAHGKAYISGISSQPGSTLKERMESCFTSAGLGNFSWDEESVAAKFGPWGDRPVKTFFARASKL